MAIAVFEIAYRHTTDIDPERTVEAPRLESLANVCVARAKRALESGPSGYSDVQRFVLAEILTSMQITHRTITTLLRHRADQPESVDVLAVARVQLEGLYAFCLMMEDPLYVDMYLKDGWKKRYIQFLLEREEHSSLPRFHEFLNTVAPENLRAGRDLYGITENQQLTIDNEELGTPLPPGVTPQKLGSFPTPGRAIRRIAAGDRRRMLERLYPEYVELSSFTHGLPHANLLKGLLDERSLHRTLFTREQAKDTSVKDVTERAFLLSVLSIVQCAAELTVRCASDVDLLAALIGAWQYFSEDSLLGRAIWAIRTKKLLGVII